MTWTIEKLIEFKEHFGLTDGQIGKGIGISALEAWKIRNGERLMDKLNARLTGYMKAVKAGKVTEAKKMVEYFKSFKED